MKEEDKRLILDTLKASRFGLLLFAAFWIAGWLGAPIFWLYLAATFLIGFSHGRKRSPAKEAFIDWVWLTLIIIAAVWLGALLGGKGFLGLLIIVLVFSVILLWRRRSLYMNWVRHIEKRFLYGETLEERRNQNRKS